MKQILVTGSTGFIGIPVIRSLLNDGLYCIRAMVRKEPEIGFAKICFDNWKEDEKFSIFQGDLLDKKSLEKAVEGIQIIIHLAAEMDFFPSDPSKIYRVNVEGTRNLLESAISQGSIERFIYISSTEAMGPTDNHQGTEDDVCNPDSDYGKSKLAAEKIVREIGEINHLPYLILRLTGTYGPYDTFVIYEVMSIVNQGYMFFVPGSGDQATMFTYIEDVVEAIRLSVTKGTIGSTYNICPDKAFTYHEMITLIAKALGRSPPLFHLPISILQKVVAIIKPIMNIGKKRTFMWQEETLGKMLHPRNLSNSKAKKEMGWYPCWTIERGIKETVEWNFKQGRLKKMSISPLSLIAFLLFVMSCILILFI